MRRFPALVLLVAGLAVGSAYGQRSGGRGGVTGRGGGGAVAGVRSPVSARPFAGVARPGVVPRAAAAGLSGARVSAGVQAMRRANAGSGGFRRPYSPGYRVRGGYGYPYAYTGAVGWFAPGLLSYPGDAGPYDSAGPAAEPEGAQAMDQVYTEPPAVAPAAAAYGRYAPAPEPDSEDAVTLIFRDGRPPEQIRNYLLTRTTLYVQDARRHEIPLEQLDLSATQRVNREAGVDFRLPDAAR